MDYDEIFKACVSNAHFNNFIFDSVKWHDANIDRELWNETVPSDIKERFQYNWVYAFANDPDLNAGKDCQFGSVP